MAQKRWVGTVNGVGTTAGNWSPSGAPIAADDVFYPKDGVVNNPTSGMNFDGVEFRSVQTQEGATYDIGSTGNEFIASPKFVRHEGLGTLYFNYKDAGAYAGDPRGHIVIRSNSIGKKAAVIGGDEQFDQLDVVSGFVECTHTGNILKVFAVPERNAGAPKRAILKITGGATIPVVLSLGGDIEITSIVATAIGLHGGTLKISSTATGGAKVTMTNGILDWQVTNLTTNWEVIALGGVVDTTNAIGTYMNVLRRTLFAEVREGVGFQITTSDQIIGDDFILPP